MVHGSAPTPRKDISFTTQTVKSTSLLGTTTPSIEIKKIGSKEFRRKIQRLAPIASQTGVTASSGSMNTGNKATIGISPDFPQEFLDTYSKKLDRMAVMVAYRAKFVHPLLQRIIIMFEAKAEKETNNHKKMAYTYIARKLSQYISQAK